MSADPLGGSILNPQTLNRYAYVGNDAVNYVDPSGMKFCVPVGEYSPAACDPHPTGFDDPLSLWVELALDSYFSSPVPNPDYWDNGDCLAGDCPGVPQYINGEDYVPFPAPQFGTEGGQGGGPQAEAPAQTCTGVGRGLGNNGALVGNPGAIPGVDVGLETAAVAPSQFGLPDTGAALVPYAANISGEIGSALFSSVSDVIGGASPIPGMNVRAALQEIYPGQLLVEIYGAGDQGVNAPVSINVPAGLGCPAGTGPAVLGDPVLPPSGTAPAVVRRIRR